MNLLLKSSTLAFLTCASSIAFCQSPLAAIDRSLSSVPLSYQSSVKPGGLLAYNTKTHEVYYEGRSAKAQTFVPVANSETVLKTQVTATRSGDIGLTLLGYSPSASLKITNKLDYSQAVIESSLLNPENRPRPLDALVYQDRETIDTAYDGYLKYRFWEVYLIEGTFTTKALSVTTDSSIGIKLSSGAALPDCVAASTDKPATTADPTDSKKTTTSTPASTTKPADKASSAALPDAAKPVKPAATTSTDATVAKIAPISVAIKGCRDINQVVQLSSDVPVVIAMKLVKIIPDASKPLGFDFTPITRVF
jgi:hypothetical protein